MCNVSNKNFRIDFFLVVASLVAVGSAFLSLYKGWPVLSYGSILATDVYLIAVILTAAVRADKKNNTYQFEWVACWLFPSRRVGVLTIPLLALVLIVSFAGLYYSINGGGNFKPDFATDTDALYFSFVTLTTVGIGDIAPLSEEARKLVMFEISSGFLILIGAFPLLISRVSNF